jgi:hypothetical protein
MERRLHRLEEAFRPHDHLRLMCTHVADQRGLDPEELYLEAVSVLRQIGERRLTLDDLGTHEGISPDELTRMTQELRTYWRGVA